MNLSVVILVFLPMILDVVYSDESTSEISSVLDLFPEFVQMKDETNKTKNEMNKMKNEMNKMKDEMKVETNKMKDEMKQLKKESTPSSHCPYSFVRLVDHCYLYVPVEATWIEAQMYCRVFGGSLASVETSQVLARLQNFLHALKAPEFVWTDGTDVLNEGYWHWTKKNNLQEFIRKAGTGFWHSSQPNSKGNEDCAGLWKISGQYGGHDAPCFDRYTFICEA